MPLQSDLQLDASKFDEKNISEQTKEFNEGLMKVMSGGPKWYEVRQPNPHLSMLMENEWALMRR